MVTGQAPLLLLLFLEAAVAEEEVVGLVSIVGSEDQTQVLVSAKRARYLLDHPQQTRIPFLLFNLERGSLSSPSWP